MLVKIRLADGQLAHPVHGVVERVAVLVWAVVGGIARLDNLSRRLCSRQNQIECRIEWS